MIANLEWK